MRSFLGVAVALVVVTLGAVGISVAQEGLTKRDSQGPVTVVVTLTAPPVAGDPVTVRVVLDTHSVGLDGIAFDKAVAVRTSDGADVAPTSVKTKGSGHHREAVVAFPPLVSTGPVRIVVKNVGGVAERSFVWELPPAR